MAVYISVYRDGLTGGVQLSIDDEDGGFRLAGPKFSGNSSPLIRCELDLRTCNELEHYISKARAALGEKQ